MSTDSEGRGVSIVRIIRRHSSSEDDSVLCTMAMTAEASSATSVRRMGRKGHRAKRDMRSRCGVHIKVLFSKLQWVWTVLKTDLYAMEEELKNANRVIIMGRFLDRSGNEVLWKTAKPQRSKTMNTTKRTTKLFETFGVTSELSSTINSSFRSGILKRTNSAGKRTVRNNATQFNTINLNSTPNWRIFLRSIVKSLGYEMVVWVYNISFAIQILNIESNFDVTDVVNYTGIFKSHLFFYCWFLLDVFLRVLALGKDIMLYTTDLFDVFLLIFIGLGVIGMSAQESSWYTMQLAFLRLQVLRVGRVLRIAFWLRKSFFIMPWIILNCVFYTMKVLLWGTAFGMLLLFCFAIFLQSYVGNPDKWYSRVFNDINYGNINGMNMGVFVNEMYGSTSKTMYTLFVTITLSWAERCIPIAQFTDYLIVVVLFSMFVIVFAFGYLNLVIAMIVRQVRHVYMENEIIDLKVLSSHLVKMHKIMYSVSGKYIEEHEIYKLMNEHMEFRGCLRDIGGGVISILTFIDFRISIILPV
eukprot:GHVH01016079.1.p1 GENE.GHVH01016079.1~~GHVH01016079.1.p1  ORF type:complete len:526 (+),score=31.64 GHVH01016079.1:26-1603(+)